MNLSIRQAAVIAAALATAALGASSALAGSPDQSVSSAPAPQGGYECPLPPEDNPLPSAKPYDSFDARELKGLRLRAAERAAARHDCSVRVVRRDGKDLAVTEDYSPQRINLNLRDGRVKRIRGIF